MDGLLAFFLNPSKQQQKGVKLLTRVEERPYAHAKKNGEHRFDVFWTDPSHCKLSKYWLEKHLTVSQNPDWQEQ